jgi:hypothetical protein
MQFYAQSPEESIGIWCRVWLFWAGCAPWPNQDGRLAPGPVRTTGILSRPGDCRRDGGVTSTTIPVEVHWT